MVVKVTFLSRSDKTCEQSEEIILFKSVCEAINTISLDFQVISNEIKIFHNIFDTNIQP